MSAALYVLVFLATLLAVEGVYVQLRDRRRAERASVRRRLRDLAAGLQARAAQPDESVLRQREQGATLDRLLRWLPGAESLELRLYRARMTMRPGVFVAMSLALAVGGWVLGSILFSNPLLGPPNIALGLLPWLSMTRRGRKRMQLFEEQFLEALELLTRALRAGHSLLSGFQMVGEELPDPIGTEFSHVSEEIKLGQSVRNALANLAYRVDAPDLPFFVTAVLIQRETGGNLAEILEKLNYVIRERFKLYGKIRAMTAIGRLSANLLAVWPLFMIAALAGVNKDYVAPLWETQPGHLLALAAAGFVLAGYVFCRRAAIIRV